MIGNPTIKNKKMRNLITQYKETFFGLNVVTKICLQIIFWFSMSCIGLAIFKSVNEFIL